jgi:hypothetical protein
MPGHRIGGPYFPRWQLNDRSSSREACSGATRNELFVHADNRSVLIQIQHINRIPHKERVHRSAGSNVKRLIGGQRLREHQSLESSKEGRCRKHPIRQPLAIVPIVQLQV